MEVVGGVDIAWERVVLVVDEVMIRYEMEARI